MQLAGDKPAAPEPHKPLTATVINADVTDVETDALVVNLFQGVESPGGATGAVDAALGGAISRLIAAGDLRGKLGETAVLYPQGEIRAKRVIVVGLGPERSFSVEAARRAAGAASLAAKRVGAADLATVAHGAASGSLGASLQPEAAAQATLEGALLATYSFAGWRNAKDERRLERVTLVEVDPAKATAFEDAARVANALNAGASLARDLVNMPPNVATPRFIAEKALALTASTSLKVEVGDLAWAEARKMGAYVAVGRGSANPPAFVRMEHNAARKAAHNDLPTIVLVGKGVSFDSGGLSMKTAAGMVTMKCDMGGAAAVIGTMLAVSLLDLPLHVVGLCPCVENMPDGAAYRPGDVLVASNGVSIEIISTDAEGRLALADALVHAGEYKPQAVIDMATLTGASVTALGAGVASSLFSTDDSLSQALVESGQQSGEKVWPMPLFDDYRQTIKSKVVADIKNSGGQQTGVGTAAVFLQEFTSYPWAHVDMAGMALDDAGSKDKPYQVPGATGYGVRLLVGYLRGAARRAVT